MTYPQPKSASSAAAELSSNEEWDDVDNLLPRASVVLSSSPSSKREPLHQRHDRPISTSTFQPAATSTSPLDDFLSGKQDKKFPFGFTLSVPCSKLDQKHHALEDYAEESSCSGESATSELTLMTYRAELMKEAIMIEFQKFKQKKKEQFTMAHPKDVRSMFSQTLSCPLVQHSMNSFVNENSVKLKAEERQQSWDAEEDDDLSLQQRVDELFVEFGVRPIKSSPDLDEGVQDATRPPEEVAQDEQQQHVDEDEDVDALIQQHLKSVIQLKLQLAQKQSFIDEMTSKYNRLRDEKHRLDDQVNGGSQKSTLDANAENFLLRQENEMLREQLDQMQVTLSVSVPPPRNGCKEGHYPVAPSQLHHPSRPSSAFNIHQELQDRMNSVRMASLVNTKVPKDIVDTTSIHKANDAATAKQVQTPPMSPPRLFQFKSFGTLSTELTTTTTDPSFTSSGSLEHPTQPTLNLLNSFSSIIQGWRRNRPTRSDTSITQRLGGQKQKDKYSKSCTWPSGMMLDQEPPSPTSSLSLSNGEDEQEER